MHKNDTLIIVDFEYLEINGKIKMVAKLDNGKKLAMSTLARPHTYKPTRWQRVKMFFKKHL